MSKTIEEIFKSMTDEQQEACYALIGAAVEEAGVSDMAHADIDEEEEEMNTMKHSEMTNQIMTEAKKMGSLKDAILQHADTYGIKDIEQLFPVEKNLSNKPGFIDNNVQWVNKILGKVSKSPFARVKVLFSDISLDTVRAKGYAKGTLKEEDVLSLMKRITEPTTIYKKGKMDRDDIIDITDFDVVAWIKETMRMKLDQELARAILIGDGRLPEDEHKIDEEAIRPIYNDDDFYAVKVSIDLDDASNKYQAFIDSVIRARKNYKGSGNPALYTTEDLISELLLLNDSTGRRLYNDMEGLRSALRVSEIITISEMEGVVRTDDQGGKHNVLGIIVNMADYTVGTDRGGKVSMFDDFDIDYNQQKYLIETRCSGALTVPYSALVIEETVTGE